MTIVFELSYCNVYGTGYQLYYVYRNNGSGIAVEYITGTSNLLSNLRLSQPMSAAMRNGYRHFVTFTDELSRYGYIYLMKHKSETFEKFKEF
jgi:hypothetical protein